MTDRPPLSQAEAQRIMQIQSVNQSMPEDLPPGVKGGQVAEDFESLPFMSQVGRGASENLSNMGNRALDSVDKLAYRMDKAPPSNPPWTPKRSGAGLGYDIGVGATDLLPYIAEQALLTNPFARTAAAIGTSGVLHGDFKKGLKEGAIGEAIGAAVPFGIGKVGKLGGDIAEAVSRTKYGGALKKGIENTYNQIKEKAYEPVEKFVTENVAEAGAKFKDFYKNKLSSKKAGLDTSKHVTRVIDKSLFDTGLATGDIADFANRFRGKPNIENAKELKTLLHNEIASLNPSDIANRKAISQYEKAIKSLESGIFSTLEEQVPGLGKVWRESNKEWATNKIPFDKNKVISDIAEGKGHKHNNEAMAEALRDITAGKNPIAGKGHYLAGLSPELESKLGSSELYAKALKAVGGGVLGGAVGAVGGPLGAAVASLTGAGAGLLHNGALLSPSARQKLSAAIMSIGKAKTPFQVGVRGMYGNEDQPPNPYYQ